MPSWLNDLAEILQPVTPIGLVLTAVYLIFSGKLVARRVVQDIREDRDARVEEAREQTAIWREAYRVSEEARQAQHDLLRESLEGVHTITHLLESRRPELDARRPDLPNAAGGELDVR